MSERTSIRVWDIPVRIFHWSLVLFFAAAFLSGDEESAVHIYAGYAIIALVLFRVVWGFAGGEHARFRDFVFGPGKLVQYLKSLMAGRPVKYPGHNPAGGYMVILMLVTLLVVTFSGLKAYGAEGHGPLAGRPVTVVSIAHAEEDGDENGAAGNHAAEEYWEEIHEAASYFMLGLIVLHLLGVAVSSHLHRENLVKAMITGNKEQTK